MHEGLDADDIYVMVEDEFYATAKTFTQHLHHAEYQRLKNSAKMRNASALNNIMRPTDSITAMREETKKKKEAESKAMKHKAALEKIKAQGGSKRLRTGDSDDESDLEAVTPDDPWVGTNLQSLMVNPRKNGTSLTGLDRIKSSTRAAAGYSKPNHRSPQVTKSFGLTSSKPTASKKATIKAPEQDNDDEATASDDDDLDAPVLRRKARPIVQSTLSAPNPRRGPLLQSNTKQVNFKHRQTPPSELSLPLPFATPQAMKRDRPQPTSKLNPTSKSTPTYAKGILKPSKPLPDFDVCDDLTSRQPVISNEASKRRAKRIADLKARAKKEDSNPIGAVNINEIPIFLV